MVLTSLSGQTLKYSAKLVFQTSNNAAEYEGNWLGLRQGRALGTKRVCLLCDSQLALEQLAKNYRALDSEMTLYIQKVQEMDEYFMGFEVCNIRRMENQEADGLTKAVAG